MGYRQYFYEVDKHKVDEIRKCKTEEELYQYCIKNGIECSKNEWDNEIEYYMPLYHLGRELFNFGKFYENEDDIYKNGDSLFTSDELNERYSDYGAIICNKKALLSAIEWQKQRIIKIYENLINNTFEDSFERYAYAKDIDEKELHFKRLLHHCTDHLRWWKPEFGDYTAINLDEENDNLVDSWLYEHTIFDLVRIYKTFDWENKCLMFMGW